MADVRLPEETGVGEIGRSGPDISWVAIDELHDEFVVRNGRTGALIENLRLLALEGVEFR